MKNPATPLPVNVIKGWIVLSIIFFPAKNAALDSRA
jgi:hypothetical protein